MENRGATFKVFLSSSFLDMHEERDYLQNHAFKSINSWLRPKGYRLEVMDLRGSTLQAEEEMQRAEVAVLNSCLRRVTECRPRLIGLLGDRYGWVCYESGGSDQPFYIRETLEAMAKSAGIPVEETFDKSITQLEIEHGFRIMDKEKCFFYCRSGIPEEGLTAREKDMYFDGKPKQYDLKLFAASQYAPEERAGHVRRYNVRWDSSARRITGLEQLNQMVEEDLRASIETELATEPQASPQVIFEQVYLENKRRYTYPFPLHVELETFMQSDAQPNVMLVRGAEGSGKSVLVSQISGIGEREDVMPYVLGVHSQAGTAKEMLRSFYGRLCDRNKTLNIYQNDWKFSDVMQVFARELEIYCETNKLILVIDGADKLKEDGYAANLQFLPERLPKNCRVVLTAGEGYVHYRTKEELVEVTLPPFGSGEEVEMMLDAMAQRYSKTYDPTIRALAAQKIVETGGSPLYARILNDYLMTMTAEEYRAFASADAHLLWMKQQIGEMPAELDRVYGKVYSRACHAYGEKLTVMTLWLAAFSPRGVATHDLAAMLDILETRYERRTLLELRDYLEAHMTPARGYDSWTPEHESFIRFLAQQHTQTDRDAMLQVILIYNMRQNTDGNLMGEFVTGCYFAHSPGMLLKFMKSLPTEVTAEVMGTRASLHHVINRYPDGCDFVCEAIALAKDTGEVLSFMAYLFTDYVDPRATGIPIEKMIRILNAMVAAEEKSISGLQRLTLGKTVRAATIANNLLALCYNITKEAGKAQQAQEAQHKAMKIPRLLRGKQQTLLMETVFKINNAQGKIAAGDREGAIEIYREAIAELENGGYRPGGDPHVDTPIFQAYSSLAYNLIKRDAQQARYYLDGAKRIIDATAEPLATVNWSSIHYMDLMNYYDYLGDEAQAFEYAKQSFSLCQQEAARDDKDFGLLHNLATFCSRARGVKGLPPEFTLKVAEANAAARRKMAERMGAQDRDVNMYAVSLFALGNTYRQQGREEDAAKAFAASVEACMKVQGSSQVSPYNQAKNLGNAAYEYANSKACTDEQMVEYAGIAMESLIRLPEFAECTEADKKLAEKAAPIFGWAGLRRYREQDYDTARACYEKSSAAWRAVYEIRKYTPNALAVAVAERNIGLSLTERGKQLDQPKEYRRLAVPHYDEYIAWIQVARELGEGYREEQNAYWGETEKLYKHVAADYFLEGAFPAALEYFEKRLKVLGQQPQDTYVTLYNTIVAQIDVGNTLDKLGRADEALIHRRSARMAIGELRLYEEYNGTLDAYMK